MKKLYLLSICSLFAGHLLADQPVVVDGAMWADMTNILQRVRAEKEKTAAGRVMLHGKRVSNVVDADRRVRVEKYADGWTIELPMQRKDGGRRLEDGTLDLRYPRELRDIERRKREIEKMQPREVTIEHNAATGEEVVK